MERVDPRVAAAAIAALMIGWQLAEKWLDRTFELDQLGEDGVADHLARLCGYICELALPASKQPTG